MVMVMEGVDPGREEIVWLECSCLTPSCRRWGLWKVVLWDAVIGPFPVRYQEPSRTSLPVLRPTSDQSSQTTVICEDRLPLFHSSRNSLVGDPVSLRGNALVCSTLYHLPSLFSVCSSPAIASQYLNLTLVLII